MGDGDGEQGSTIRDTSLADWFLVLFTAALTAATFGLLVATRRLGKATDAMSAATTDMAQATLQRTRLDYRSRITGDWDFRDGNAILTLKDERGIPMKIESIYAGTSHNRTEGESRSRRIRMSRVNRDRYDTPLRGEGEPVYVILPCPVPADARRIVLQARVSYRDHASTEPRKLEFVAALHIELNGTVRLEPYKLGGDEDHYSGEDGGLLEEELGMWVPDEGLGG
ncbi:MAG: hypothetical protein OXG96_02280 [Acidobacteria bacterium]|nr:hypothetical protein [Acidobacteriota bacterium]